MKEKKYYDMIFPLLTLCFFIMFGSIMIGTLAVSAQNISALADKQENISISLAYIKNKVQQTDDIHIAQIEEINALVLTEQQQQITYQTYIYVYENTLRELYLQQGVAFDPKTGTIISDMEQADFQIQEQLLTISLIDLNNQQKHMQIYLTERQK